MKKVQCVTTGEIYNSAAEASRATGVDASNITKCCRGERESAGTVEQLVKQELTMEQEEMSDYIKNFLNSIEDEDLKIELGTQLILDTVLWTGRNARHDTLILHEVSDNIISYELEHEDEPGFYQEED